MQMDGKEVSLPKALATSHASTVPGLPEWAKAVAMAPTVVLEPTGPRRLVGLHPTASETAAAKMWQDHGWGRPFVQAERSKP
jgi:hypothetical protein